MLLCSDGLNGMINDETIRSIIIKDEIHLIERTQQLIESAKKAGGTDNITAQLIKFYAQNRAKSTIPSVATPASTPANALASTPANALVNTPAVVYASITPNASVENSSQEKKPFNTKKIIIPAVILAVFLGFFLINSFQNKAEAERKQREKIVKFKADSLKQINDSLVKIVTERLLKDTKDSLAKLEKEKKDSLKDAKKAKIEKTEVKKVIKKK